MKELEGGSESIKQGRDIKKLVFGIKYGDHQEVQKLLELFNSNVIESYRDSVSQYQFNLI